MRAKELLLEKALARDDFGPESRKTARIATFIKKINSGSPFKLAGSKKSVILRRDRIALNALKTMDYTKIPSSYLDQEGNLIRLTQLEKTQEFGSTESTGRMNKEKLPLKPSQIGITGTGEKFDPEQANALQVALATGAFPASELGTKIISNPVLKKAGKVGAEVIRIATEISNGIIPTMPTNLPDAARTAIRDYAGEYLGIQQLIVGTANFPAKEEFFQFMDTDQAGLGSLILYFPQSANTPLADSLALQNGATGHVIKLSSKGGAQGAPPSLDNLKIPDEMLQDKNKAKRQVLEFLQVAQASKTKTQPFDLMQFLIAKNPSSVPEFVRNMFPITQQEFNALIATHKDLSLPCPRKFLKLANIKDARTGDLLSGSHFGRVYFQLNKIILNAVNNENVFPAFQKTVIELLGYNFIQVFSREKGNKLTADVLWPGKVRGNVSLYSKSGSSEIKGKLGFSVT
jgi:hypothetical protein